MAHLTQPSPGGDAVDGIIDFAQHNLRLHDHLVHGTAADGMIRAVAVTARQTVQTARERHDASPVVTAALGRLMMAGLMMGSWFKGNDELLTLEVRGDGPIGGLTVTANNKGQVKGFANHPHVWLPLNGRGKLDVGGAVGAGTLSVVRDIPGVMPYTSQTELVSGEIGDDLAAYFQLSDQIPTSVGVGVLVDAETNVRQAGGFIVQLMPGYDPYLVDELEHSLQRVTSVTDLLEQGMLPSDLLHHVLSGLEYQELDAMPVEFHCGCTKQRAERATLALGVGELRDMVAKGETAEVHCHFCGTKHILTSDDLRRLLEGVDHDDVRD